MNSSSVSFSATAAAAALLLAVCSSVIHPFLYKPLMLGGKSADLMVVNGTIYTSDASLPFADSMAIRHGRILRVGNYSSMKDFIGSKTRLEKLQGKVVVPGVIDSHVHFIFGGLHVLMGQVQLFGVNRKEDFVNKVKEAVSNMPPGTWVLGGGWNNDLWGGELPMASWIDDITAQNPVWLSRMDGHMGLANSLALNVAGISNNTVDPDGGTVMRNSVGGPTGLLIDSAMKLVFLSIPEVSVKERREALARASDHALKRGVTAVVDVGRYLPGASPELTWGDLSDVYRWADLSGKMKIRVCLFFPIETWARLHKLINQAGRKLSEWIYLGGVKSFADGSLGSNSALFYDVAVHAIGDRSNDMILDLYKSVATENGMRDRRFRIEHAQHLAPGTAARFGKQGIFASVQPDHLLDDAGSAIKKLGVERSNEGSYLFNSLLAGNTQLVLGSDWPIADINPLRSTETAMRRVPPGWENGWILSECIDIHDALKG